MIRRPIRNEQDYEAALAAIEPYFDNQPELGTAEADDFDLLALLIGEYERRVHPISPPDPVSAIRYMMDLKGYTQSDLAVLVGSRQRASEILLGKRGLSMQMVRSLHEKWGIPLEGLISSSATAA